MSQGKPRLVSAEPQIGGQVVLGDALLFERLNRHFGGRALLARSRETGPHQQGNGSAH
jgi:hypothetical protein